MEILIVICLLVVIALLIHDKIGIKSDFKNAHYVDKNIPELQEIMGQPKPRQRLAIPSSATKSQNEKQEKNDNSFDSEPEENGFRIEIPPEELDEIFDNEPDFEEEEEEWRKHGEPNGEDGFATGVTFQELSTVGTLLQQEGLRPSLEKQAVDIVHRIQGTELFSLLENSIENASQKIARLLDKGMSVDADSGSSTMRNKGLDDFEIGEFV